MHINVLHIFEKVFPIFRWSKDYDIDSGVSDLVAGITVGLTLIPQSIAYASLAGFAPQYGLYSSLCGGAIYMIFGTTPQLNIAPTALLSLLTYTYTQNKIIDNVSAAVLLTFLSGCIELLCGLLKCGFIVDFVSTPVVSAFTSAGALTIASSQLKSLFGLEYKAENFVGALSKFFLNISDIKLWDTVLGFCCIIILLVMRKLKDFGSAPLEKSNVGKTSWVKKLMWFLSVSRNAFVVIFCAVLAYLVAVNPRDPFSLTREVSAGWPNVSLPPFQVNMNGTVISFQEIVKDLGIGIFIIPFVAILGNVAIAKAFAHGKVVDASQEMIAVGMCNIVGSFFGSYPVNASFSRSAVGQASGIRTPIAGLYTGAMVVLSFTFLTPYFAFIPKATLSSVIMCAVIFMVELSIVKIIWFTNKMDLIPFIITLLTCLFWGIEQGILIGACIDILFILYGVSRPKLIVENKSSAGKDFLSITPTSAVLYPSAEYVKEKVLNKNIEAGLECHNVVIDCQKINKIDFTAAKCFSTMTSDLEKYNKAIVFYCPSQRVSDILSKTCKTAFIANDETHLESLLKSNEVKMKVTSLKQGILKKNSIDSTPL